MALNGFSHRKILFDSQEPGAKLGESDFNRPVRLEAQDAKPSPKQEATHFKIPNGTIFGEIPLEACKAYPIRIFEGLNIEPRITPEKLIRWLKNLPYHLVEVFLCDLIGHKPIFDIQLFGMTLCGRCFARLRYNSIEKEWEVF